MKVFRSPHDEKDINIQNIFNLIRLHKIWVILIILTATSITTLYAYSQKSYFKSEAFIRNEGAGISFTISKIASRFRVLLEAADITIPFSINPNNSSIGVEIIQSKEFFLKFLDKHDLSQPLFNETNSNERENIDSLDNPSWNISKNGRLILDHAHQEFLKSVSIEDEPLSGLIRISVTHYSPIIATKRLEDILNLINEIYIQKEILKRNLIIKQIRTQAYEIKNQDIKKSLFEFILSLEQEILLLESPNYSLMKIIIPPNEVAIRLQPNKFKIIFQGIIISMIFSIILVLFLGSQKKIKQY